MSDFSPTEKEHHISEANPFEQARFHISKAQTVLDKETKRLHQEREAFDSVAKKLKHVHFSSTIKLNVGGQFFTTSLQTLTKDAGSMLHAMFSGRFDTKPAEDGSYFIDRDGAHFRYILNYLRTGKLLLPKDRLVQKELLEEAKFYLIQGIIDILTPKPYSQSEILNQKQRVWLAEAVGKPYDRYKLLYRATRDGWSSENFHKCCDNKGPTLVVIQSLSCIWKYVFGGFTEKSWDCSGNDKTDKAAFLFSLVNHPNIGPTKMKVKELMATKAIHCSASHGPVFGGGPDISINNPSNNNKYMLNIGKSKCSTNIGHTYDCPPGQSGTTFLTGDDCNVIEIEVFEHIIE